MHTGSKIRSRKVHGAPASGRFEKNGQYNRSENPRKHHYSRGGHPRRGNGGQENHQRQVDEAFERLLAQNPTLREKMVTSAYLDGDINLGKAAELLGIHPVALRKDLLERGIPIRIGSDSEESLRAEIAGTENMV